MKLPEVTVYNKQREYSTFLVSQYIFITEHRLNNRTASNLSESLPDQGSNIDFDNIHASLRFMKDLLKKNTTSCGTICVERRDFPLTFNHEELNEEDASLI